MLEYDWDQSLGNWYCSTAHAIRKLLGAQLAREKITLRQFEVLATLSFSKGCGSQAELADALGIEPHTLAGVLKRMERDGLLERTACDQDRRKNKIQPTQKAVEMWNRATAICQALRVEMTQGFSQEELNLMRNFSARVRANISAAEEALEAAARPVSAPLSANIGVLQMTPATRS